MQREGRPQKFGILSQLSCHNNSKWLNSAGKTIVECVWRRVNYLRFGKLDDVVCDVVKQSQRVGHKTRFLVAPHLILNKKSQWEQLAQYVNLITHSNDNKRKQILIKTAIISPGGSSYCLNPVWQKHQPVSGGPYDSQSNWPVHSLMLSFHDLRGLRVRRQQSCKLDWIVLVKTLPTIERRLIPR